MKKLTQSAKSTLRGNNHVLGRMMDKFNKREKTILAWIEASDLRLQTPPALEIIVTETGFSQEELFENEIAEVSQS